MRTRALLSDASVALELIGDVDVKRRHIVEAIESSRKDVKNRRSRISRRKAAKDFAEELSDQVHELRHLDALTVSLCTNTHLPLSNRRMREIQYELAEQGYDAYDRAIEEVDARIRLIQPLVPTPLPTNALSTVVHGMPMGTQTVKRRAGRRRSAEPRYCLCKGVASGEMIRCDNADCSIEWFHFSCLAPDGFSPPPGRWLCPHCRHITPLR